MYRPILDDKIAYVESHMVIWVTRVFGKEALEFFAIVDHILKIQIGLFFRGYARADDANGGEKEHCHLKDTSEVCVGGG